MSKSNQHIIHEINASVNCNTENLLHVNDANIGELIKAALEELTDDFDAVGAGHMISFSEISIDIEVRKGQIHQLKDKIKETIRNQVLVRKVEDRIENDSVVVKKTAPLSPQEVLVYFLKTGRLPWNVKSIALDKELLQGIESEDEFILSFSSVLAQNPCTTTRLVHQFSEKELIKFIEILTTRQYATTVLKFKQEVLIATKRHSKIYDLGFRVGLILFEEIFNGWSRESSQGQKTSALSTSGSWKVILSNVIKRSIELYPEIEIKLFEEAIRGTNNVSLISTFQDIKERSKEFKHLPIDFDNKEYSASKDIIIEKTVNLKESFSESSDATAKDKSKSQDQFSSSDISSTPAHKSKAKPDFVNEFFKRENKSSSRSKDQVLNAGIVLLHPFIPTFFEKVGLIENGQFISQACQQRAVCLLHFIATGKEAFEEQNLYFQKFICNYDEEESIPKDLPISQFEKDEVDKLLNAVIDHWSSLKGVTAKGLRGNYLIRKGVLQNAETEPVIHVEHQTADILLKQLPWALNIVKWSWQKKLLTIKWV